MFLVHAKLDGIVAALDNQSYTILYLVISKFKMFFFAFTRRTASILVDVITH